MGVKLSKPRELKVSPSPRGSSTQWRYDSQHNDREHNNTQHTEHCDTQYLFVLSCADRHMFSSLLNVYRMCRYGECRCAKLCGVILILNCLLCQKKGLHVSVSYN